MGRGRNQPSHPQLSPIHRECRRRLKAERLKRARSSSAHREYLVGRYLNPRLLRCERSSNPASGQPFFVNVQVFAVHQVRGRAHKCAVGHTSSPVGPGARKVPTISDRGREARRGSLRSATRREPPRARCKPPPMKVSNS
jgi:hypothetical protein